MVGSDSAAKGPASDNRFLGASIEAFFYGRPASRWPTVVKAVQDVVSMGLGVEVWAIRGASDEEVSPEDVEKLRAICGEAPFASMHARYGLWSWNPDRLRHEIALCHAVGIQTLVLHVGSVGLYGPRSSLAVPTIRQLAQEAREGNVQIALENSPNELWALDRILDQIGCDPAETNIGICVDIAHAHISKDAGRQPIRHYLKRYRRQLVHVHISDNLGEKDDHLLPGEGSINWQEVSIILEGFGYKGPTVLELHPNGSPLAALRRACAFLARSGTFPKTLPLE